MLKKYNLLCQDFFNIAEPIIDKDILEQLKCNYSYEIDSKRKLSQIKDLKMFIRLLEKRDIMSCDNIAPLWYISKKYVHNSNLTSRLEDYENWLKTTPSLCNAYKNETPLTSKSMCLESTNSESTCSSVYSLSQSTRSTKLLNNNTQKEQCHLYNKRKLLQEKVLLQVKDKLGRSWRDIARHLGIRECEIDAVQNKYPYDLKEQSYEILKIYISQSDREEWAINFIHAFEKGRRRDLKELLEKLILQDGNV
ncbi:hypothetical protein PUN28_008840 [Cardiocondyla obscurior]